MNTIKTTDEKTIVVATDFSVAAMNAAAYAAEMAAALGKELLLLHIVILQAAYSEIPVSIDTGELIEDAEKELCIVKEQLNRQTDGLLKIETAVRTGTFFAELKTVCEEIKPYAVVMGSQGTSAAERLIFGGHAVYAMQHLRWTLITVPLGIRPRAIKKIGLACDFDNVIYKIPIEEVKGLVKDFQASLHVLNIGRKGSDNSGVIFESGLLQQRLKDVKPVYHFITHEHTDEAIIDFAEKNELDLLVVLPKRRNLFEQLVHKSHTRQLVLHAHLPVMALHQ
jgi:nucleotide-binding universal stress UspA family protein